MRVASLIFWILLCQGTGLLGARWTTPEIPRWYAGLRKPSFNPPNWIFGPVWTTLYLLMAVAAWRIWELPSFSLRTTALILFLFQLGLNLAWTYIFFRRHALRAAVVEIGVLWLAIAACIVVFARVDAPSAWLMAPYLAWVTFAAALNTAIAYGQPHTR